MIHDTQGAQISQKQDGRDIYVIMKIMCPPGYHHIDFVVTHALGHTVYGLPKCMSCHKAIGVKTGWAHHCYIYNIVIYHSLQQYTINFQRFGNKIEQSVLEELGIFCLKLNI